MSSVITPSIKDKVWKSYTEKPSSKSELKNIFLGNNPTDSYSKINIKLKKHLDTECKKKSASPKRKSASPKRKSASPKRKSGSPKRKSLLPVSLVSSKKKSESPKRKSLLPKKMTVSIRKK